MDSLIISYPIKSDYNKIKLKLEKYLGFYITQQFNNNGAVDFIISLKKTMDWKQKLDLNIMLSDAVKYNEVTNIPAIRETLSEYL